MTYTMLLEPRLHPEDASNATIEPLQTWFAEAGQLNARRQNKWLKEKATLLLVPPHDEWVKNLISTLALVLMQGKTWAAALFIKVLWCQSDFNMNRVNEPLELLRKAQVDSLKKPIRLERCIPRKISALDALVEDDVSHSEAEDSDSDPSDLFVDPEYTVSQENTPVLKRGWKSNQSHSPIPIEADGPLRSPNLVLTSKNKTAWCNELEGDPAVLRYVVSSPEGGERYPDMGSVIQQMKSVRRRIYNRNDFRDLVTSSGLQLIFETLCDEACASEVDPRLAESYRLHNWRNQLNLVWNDWSPQEIYAGKEWQKVCLFFLKNKLMPAKILNADGKAPTFNFLRALADNVWMIPRGTSPALAVFFLASLPNFLQAWELWLRGALLRAVIKIDDWSPGKLYRGLVATRAAKWPEILCPRNIICPPELQLLLNLNEEHQENPKLPHSSR
ncbi:hypothetical protein DFH08DRAFT_817130 [Mycena albidolilacea]|uniref:Uncharacterized protein n=1 Tax=Mycena albidolilacea TaxID=1033008 RepID=A0AAD6ZJ54_9AGAR|nr:hypothetical protein DFH08DRAFT_817130 [Mycena albidolilacea]